MLRPRTIEGVHQRIAGNRSASTTGRSSQRMVDTSLVATHNMLDSFVCSEVNSMSGT